MSQERLDPTEELLWREGERGILDLRRLTGGRPCCAGVLLVRDGKLLITFSAEDTSADEASGTDWFVGGVGGGQEPGEDLWACARREGLEELGASIRLESSDLTFLHDGDAAELGRTRSRDEPAPFLLERRGNDDPARPFKPGLPAGPFTYFAMFLAEFIDDEPEFRPGDPDVAALVWMPLDAWSVLDDDPSFATLQEMGATIEAGGPIAEEARIHLSPKETLRAAAPLLATEYGV